MNHFWVVGTDTDVGKTFITTLMMRYLQRTGYKVVPYKPVQTGEVKIGDKTYYYDTTTYLNYSLQPLSPESINSYSFPVPASPHYAAELEGEWISGATILNKINQLMKEYDAVICEGAGGLYVPLQPHTTLTLLDIIQRSKLPVVLVTHPKLGTINHTLLSLGALNSRGIEVLGIVINRFGHSPIEENNIQTLQRFIPDKPFVVVEENRTIDSFDEEMIFERLIKRDLLRTSES
ncbi:dethiobiotin synthase [Ureibacillus thermophilus]|uniref:ATP-dependent dethiobiotin synthetase BioD n=1 Tax=Ureibacillus thermophilus TaxID=367743 RepID=A0A4P6UTJ6_9BACL|nr:dethiobiotin synthase [Ureibacillus thermophilus]QBK26669.1 dethiobiotin synthase [Ureibacillus thermophilus]